MKCSISAILVLTMYFPCTLTNDKTSLPNSFSAPSFQIVINNTPINQANNTNEHTTEQHNCQQQEVHSEYTNTITTKQINSQMQYITSSAKKFFDHYRLFIGTSMLIGTYSLLCYKSWHTRTAIKQAYWAEWAHNHTVDLNNSDNALLLKVLLQAIHYRYIDMENPLNQIYALILFLKDVQKELYILTQYQSYSSWIHRLQLHRLIPFNIPSTQLFDAYIMDLSRLQELFKQWIAMQKVDMIHAR